MCFAGSQCAGTVLDGNYTAGTDSRLVSASYQLPTITGVDEIHLRFQQWFAFSGSVSGQVQVSVWDPMTSTWGSWISEGTAVTAISGGWSLKGVDLTAYSGERVRVGFLHTSNTSAVAAGWYIDDVTIVRSWPREHSMMAGIDETFDGVIFLGYHASTNNTRGVRAHTMSSANITSVRLNGMTMTEGSMNAAIAGHFGVPVILVSGDDAIDFRTCGILKVNALLFPFLVTTLCNVLICWCIGLISCLEYLNWMNHPMV